MIGILRGMGITLRNFMASYVMRREPETLRSGAMVTVQYPEERLKEKENFRNFPFLLYDKTPDNLRCVACDICAKECPPKCIYIVREFDKDGKPLKRPAVFDIDLTVCMNCGICEEACPFDAIFMDHTFEIASADRQSALLFQKEDLLKSNDYFNKIRPTDAAVIDTKRAEVDAKKKAAEQAAAAKAAAAAAAPKPAATTVAEQPAAPAAPEPPKTV